MDIYKALYPIDCADAFETETFSMNLEKQYGFDLSKIQDVDITLGQLFEITRKPNNEIQPTI